MLTRLWFVLSIGWCVFCTSMMLASHAPAGSVPYELSAAFAPLVIGLALRLIWRYVLYGPRMRRY